MGVNAALAFVLAIAGIEAPASGGSGETILLRMRSAGLPRIETDAGTLGAPVADPAGDSWRVELVAPRVSAPTWINVSSGEDVVRIRIDPPASAEPATSGGRFDLRAVRTFRLGVDTGLTMSARAGERPELAASEGAFTDPRHDGDRWIAEWRPAGAKMPRRVALVAYSSTAADVVWVDLLAQAKVELDTEPRATVTLAVGNDAIGPFRADGQGDLAVPVRVPPGVEAAIATVVDAVGNRREVRIPLGTPPAERVFAVCAGERMFAAVSGGGKPAVRADRGRVVGPEPVPGAPGLWTAELRAPEEVAVGARIRLHASVAGTKVESSCEATVAGKRVVGVDMSLDRAEWAAGSGTVGVTLSLRWAGNGPLPEVRPELSVTAGTVGTPRSTDSGELVADWHPPDRLPAGDASIEVRVAGHSARATLALSPGPPARLEVLPAKKRIFANGAVRVPVQVVAEDAFGNVLEKEDLSLEAELGRIEAPRTGDGGYRAEYVPPARTRPAREHIVLSAGDRSAQAEVRLGASGRVVGAGIGYLSNLGALSAAAFSTELRMPVLRPDLTAGVELGWRRSESRARASGIVEPVTARIDAIPAFLSGAWTAHRPRFAPYVGAGAGVLFARTETESASSGRRAESAVEPFWGVFAGVETPFGPGRAAFELRWTEATVSGRVDGNLGGLEGMVRYRFGI